MVIIIVKINFSGKNLTSGIFYSCTVNDQCLKQKIFLVDEGI